ncbi:polysaccharide pyruvyl transferase family protein [Priestia megaterium]
MKKIGFFGSVGYNIGDEAIAVASAYKLKDIHPNSEIYISTIKKNIVQGVYQDINEFYLDRKTVGGWLRLLSFIKSLDCIFIGGGGMVQDKLGISRFKGMLPYVYQIACIGKIFNKPIYTLPIGVDELETDMGLTYAEKFLKKVDYLFVRDNQSKLIAQNILKDSQKEIHVAADPAFLLEYNLTELSGCKYICISLVKENLDIDILKTVIVSVIKWVMNNTPYHIVLVPMERREDDEISLFKEILTEIEIYFEDAIIDNKEQIQEKKVSVFNAENNIFEFINVLRSSELLIAMRLHAMILSLGYTQILNISRTTKTETLSKDFDIPLLDIKDIDVTASEKIIDFIKKKSFEKTSNLLVKERKEILQNTFKNMRGFVK